MNGRFLQSLPSTDDGEDDDGSGDSKSPELRFLFQTDIAGFPKPFCHF